MKRIWIFLTFIGLSTIIIGQDKLLKIEDAVIGNNYHMYPERMSRLKWQGDSDNYTFVKENTIFRSNVKSKSEKAIFNLEDLNKILKNNSLEERKSLPYYSWYDANTISFYQDKLLLGIDIKKKKLVYKIELKKSAENKSFDKASKILAYTEGNNIFLSTTEENSKQITHDTVDGIVNGTGYVHRSEFGIHEGIFWSPKSNCIAFYRKDESMVKDYPLVKIGTRIAEPKNTKYPMAGMKSEEVTLGIYHIQNDKTIFINTGEPKEQYLTSIVWGPEEEFIYIGILNRGQDHLKFNQYNAKTGDFIQTIFEEKHTAYVEPENPPVFFKSKPNEFLWLSERDGYKHIYHYNTNGDILKQLTKGNWVVKEIIGIDPAEQYVYFYGNRENPIENHVYQYSLEEQKITHLTKEAGTHTAYFNEDYSAFIDILSSTTVPGTYTIKNNKGETLKTLLQAENPMKDFKVGEMSIFTIKAADGESDLYCRMIKPVDFDSTKKYPAIVYVYGGPHSQLVTNEYLGGAWIWQYYMAQKGYVLLTLDNRGTDNRGFAFENCTHRNLGVQEVEDQMQGIDYLINTGYIDSTRIGLHGWSYGGFMTLSMMSKYPEKFKVGVAGGPVTDWKFYEVMYGERYMDTPEENPEGYKKTSLLNKVPKLKDERVLIIHGGIDNTVVPQNSFELLEKAIKNDVLLDFFIYPTHEHNVRGKDRIHLMKKVTRYFEDYL